jgi:hypothetical protein
VTAHVTNLAWYQLAARWWIINIFLEIRNPDSWRIEDRAQTYSWGSFLETFMFLSVG